MGYPKTALWTIPYFEFKDIYKFYRDIPNIISTFSNSLDPDQRAPIGAL